MNTVITLLVIAFIFAQFHPRGRIFLNSDAGAATTVAVAAVAALSMIPGLLLGQVLNIAFIAIWGFVAYPRLGAAKRYIKYHLPRLPRR